MHTESMAFMEKHLKRIPFPLLSKTRFPPKVLDVGSRNINGDYRALCNGLGMSYTGLDIEPGPNVDIVSKPYSFPVSEYFDVVVCGNMLHCVEKPWLLLPEMTRVLRPSGLLIVVTVFNWGINEYPKDYFRYSDNGLRSLFDETKCLMGYEIEMNDGVNVAGSAIKR